MGNTSKKHQLDEYLNAGRSYSQSHQFKLAIVNYQRALILAEKLKDGKKESKGNIELGTAYIWDNQIQTAIKRQRHTLT